MSSEAAEAESQIALRRFRLDRIALVAEIVAAVCVVISLIFVGIQLQRNTNELIGATHQNLLEILQTNDAWLRDPGFADIMIRFEKGKEALTDVEYVQFSAWSRDRLNACEHVNNRRQEGVISDEFWAGWVGGCAAHLQNPTTLALFYEIKSWYGPGVATWFEGLIEEQS